MLSIEKILEEIKTNHQYFEMFSFGDSHEMADELSKLVLKGKKTATVSVYPDGAGKPACMIKTVFLDTIPFCNLT